MVLLCVQFLVDKAASRQQVAQLEQMIAAEMAMDGKLRLQENQEALAAKARQEQEAKQAAARQLRLQSRQAIKEALQQVQQEKVEIRNLVRQQSLRALETKPVVASGARPHQESGE